MARSNLLVRADRARGGAVTEGFAAESLPIVGIKPVGEVGAGRDDPRGVNVFVSDVIVLFNLHKIDRVAKARCLEQVACVAPEIRHLGEPVAVRLEMAVVDRVEAGERREEPHVSLSDRSAHEVAAGAEPLFEPIHRLPEPRICGIVGVLAPRKAAAVHPVVHLGENAGDDRPHLLEFALGEQVRCTLTVKRLPLG